MANRKFLLVLDDMLFLSIEVSPLLYLADNMIPFLKSYPICLLYTSDAADEL